MKVNNPLYKNGVHKIGEYNNFPIYYSSAQGKNSMLRGNKEGKIFYIVGITNITKIKQYIQEHEK